MLRRRHVSLFKADHCVTRTSVKYLLESSDCAVEDIILEPVPLSCLSLSLACRRLLRHRWREILCTGHALVCGFPPLCRVYTSRYEDDSFSSHWLVPCQSTLH